MNTRSTFGETNVFKKTLEQYKQLIDDDIAQYTLQLQKSTLQYYGANARLELDAFLGILGRGGKRIRGALTILGYEMSGGQDREMILQAARAVEMIHAYLLIIDDIQDRSIIRRGGPTAHMSLSEYHKYNELANSSEHFGLSLAINAALAGQHAAQMLLINLAAPEHLRLKALNIVNQTTLTTLHGQTSDIMNEMVAKVTEEDIECVLEWKTAQYTLLNPLHLGMVLAGADSETTDAITDYAIHTGKAFQITDDILGTFGSEMESGKSPMDDTREGKRTLLTVYALDHAPTADINFLVSTLGNDQLSPAEFERCKDILVETGALDHAQKRAKDHVEKALISLDEESHRWSKEGTEFLRVLAQYLLTRSS